MVKIIIGLCLFIGGCATDNYTYCLANREGQYCGVWVIETPPRPLQRVVRSGDRLFIETVRY